MDRIRTRAARTEHDKHDDCCKSRLNSFCLANLSVQLSEMRATIVAQSLRGRRAFRWVNRPTQIASGDKARGARVGYGWPDYLGSGEPITLGS